VATPHRKPSRNASRRVIAGEVTGGGRQNARHPLPE
jgi:hypothetical protein